MANWPSSLPSMPLSDGFSEIVPDNIIRTNMDTGASKIRRRTTASPRLLNVSYLLSKADINVLDDFYLTTLKSGSLIFSYNHPRTNISENVRFLKKPEYISTNGEYFKVNISLEILA